jgi:serine/threonine protein kinase/Tfp pilus assembly protein PilF
MTLTKCPHCQSENPASAQFCAACGIRLEPAEKTDSAQPQAAQAAGEVLTPGSTFAQRYKVKEELGQASLGKVYKAFDFSLERDVVLKLIKPEIAQDKKILEVFANELKIARKIVHKNVARMFDLSEAEGTHYIMMENVEGQDLKGLINQTGRLRIEKAVDMAIQVCEGLHQAHWLGVVHGGLNPTNIVVDKEGIAKILDFGIAKSLYTKAISEAGGIIESAEYISPEQAEGKDIDPRSDIYSLGIILYKMVTGRVPFEGDDPAAIAQRHKSDIPKIPDELEPLIPGDLSRLILKCLEKDKEKRYQTVEGLHSDLENIGKPVPTMETEEPKERIIPPKKTVTPKEARKEVKKEIKPEKKKEFPRKVKLTFDFRKLLIPALGSLAVIVLGVIIWRVILKPSKAAAPVAPTAEKHYVAILPFEDLSAAKDHEYLGDGLAETLIDALSDIDGFWVPARTSSFLFKGKSLNSSEIGRKLGVDYFLEASFQVVQNKLLLTAKLIGVKDGTPVWSDQYDRNRGDVFAIQEEIARAIVKALGVKLPAEKESSVIMSLTKNPEAYDLYLQGRHFLSKGTKENLEKAVNYFQKASEKDPGYALAYTGMADAYTVLGSNFGWPSDQAYGKARMATARALELNPHLAEAHTMLGVIRGNFDWDPEGAEREYKEAIRIKPNYVFAHQWYAIFLSTLGRHEEAITEIKFCKTLDPLSPNINANIGALLYFARQYGQALEELKRSLRVSPSYFVNYYYQGMVYIQMGEKEEAIKSFERAKELGGESLETNLRLAYVYALLGRREDVGKILTEAMKTANQSYVSQVSIASVYAALGEKDQVMACLDKAFTEHDSKLVFLKIHPMFDRVRRDPRFLSLLEKVGLQK